MMHGFFKTLIRPDREEDPELTIVARAANVLQVGEFQLLQLAYFDWYGEDMPDGMIDQVFADYMIRHQVPAWARHYARRILAEAEAGRISEIEPSYHRYDHNYVTHVPRGVRQFTLACMILAGVMVGAVLVGEVTSVEVTSVLPPYFERSDLPQGGAIGEGESLQ